MPVACGPKVEKVLAQKSPWPLNSMAEPTLFSKPLVVTEVMPEGATIPGA